MTYSVLIPKISIETNIYRLLFPLKADEELKMAAIAAVLAEKNDSHLSHVNRTKVAKPKFSVGGICFLPAVAGTVESRLHFVVRHAMFCGKKGWELFTDKDKYDSYCKKFVFFKNGEENQDIPGIEEAGAVRLINGDSKHSYPIEELTRGTVANKLFSNKEFKSMSTEISRLVNSPENIGVLPEVIMHLAKDAARDGRLFFVGVMERGLVLLLKKTGIIPIVINSPINHKGTRYPVVFDIVQCLEYIKETQPQQFEEFFEKEYEHLSHVRRFLSFKLRKVYGIIDELPTKGKKPSKKDESAVNKKLAFADFIKIFSSMVTKLIHA